MATHRFSVLNTSLDIAGSGNVFFEPFSVKATNAIHDGLVLIYENSGTKDSVNGSFVVPENFVGSTELQILWGSTATTGSATWEVTYNAIASGESTDPAAVTETISGTAATPATALLLQTTALLLTGSNFASGDLVQFTMSRDSGNVSDNLAVACIVYGVLFEYADA
jgi:hypothetical protein